MKAPQIFNFKGYVGMTLLTGLISVSAMAEVSHPEVLRNGLPSAVRKSCREEFTK